MLTGSIHHYPDYTMQDDGYGTLIFVADDLFAMNFGKYMQECS